MVGSSHERGEVVLDVSLTGAETPPLRELRQSVRGAMAHLEDECVEDAELLVTELVSNAYDHGHPPIAIRLCSVSSVMHIEVEDGDRANLPQVGVSRLGGERGRGLVLVDQLALSWGFDATATGKVVWADVSCPVSN
ncbi:ATP-binding protein [Actinosynnema sp. NPDC050436]|uniref:ATP-binding protein n=1 Tax=Actinosynnema sp. NPDC050436 TaxID=3155659 RepID=UPI0033D99FD1